MTKKFKIWNKKTGTYTGSYSRAYHDIFEFNSEEEALGHNCHGMFKDTDTYEIHEVEISEKLVKKLPPKKEYVEKTAKSSKSDKEISDYLKKNPKATVIQAIMNTTVIDVLKKGESNENSTEL